MSTEVIARHERAGHRFTAEGVESFVLDAGEGRAGVTDLMRLPGKHFLQEDQAPAIAEQIATFAAAGS